LSGGQISLHGKLKRRVVVGCVIDTNEPLHVGIGKETLSVSEVDLPTMVNKKDEPIIPGSSIKGALRAYVTRILSSLDISTGNTHFGVKKIKANEDEINDFQTEESPEIKEKKFSENLGVIDKLFGASGFASPLRLTDATLTGDTKLIKRTHVKIDNDLDRAEEGALFDIQAVPENRNFNFKLIFDEFNDSITEDVSKVFYKMILKQIGDGLEIFLGGMRSRGYGLCTIKAKQVLSYNPEELALGKTPEPITNISQFINDALKR